MKKLIATAALLMVSQCVFSATSLEALFAELGMDSEELQSPPVLGIVPPPGAYSRTFLGVTNMDDKKTTVHCSVYDEDGAWITEDTFFLSGHKSRMIPAFYEEIDEVGALHSPVVSIHCETDADVVGFSVTASEILLKPSSDPRRVMLSPGGARIVRDYGHHGSKIYFPSFIYRYFQYAL